MGVRTSGVVLFLFWPFRCWADTLLLLHADVQVEWSPRWETRAELESEYRDRASAYYDLEAMAWAGYRLTSWFKVGLGWRELRYQRAGGSRWVAEHRPLADLLFRTGLGVWTLEDRVRLEDRAIEDLTPYFRYRNRLALLSPWAWTRIALKPWLGWEGYYEDSPAFGDGRWNRNRFYAGLLARISESFKVNGVYFYERVLRSGATVQNHELELDLSFLFDLSQKRKIKRDIPE